MYHGVDPFVPASARPFGRPLRSRVPGLVAAFRGFRHHARCRAVVAVYIRSVLGFLRRRARRAGVRDGRGGAVSIVQRFGAALNLNVHVHALVLDGVFADDATGTLACHALGPPSDEEVTAVIRTVRRRVWRLLERRGLAEVPDGFEAPDPLAEEAPVLAGLHAASVSGTIALGPRADARVRRCGQPVDVDLMDTTTRGPRHAHLDGFDLHANVAVSAGQRARLERVCRYALRPPIAQDRLRHRWTDGTTHLLFDPAELLERLAALTLRRAQGSPRALPRGDAPAAGESGLVSRRAGLSAVRGADAVAGDDRAG